MALHILFRLGNPAAVVVTGEQPLYGGWGAGGIIGYRRYEDQPHRIRRLSELDKPEPDEELLFTPEDFVDVAVDKERIAAAILDRFKDVADRALHARMVQQAYEHELREALAREIDDEDEFMMV